MDVNRNVGVRDTCNDDNGGVSATQPFANLFQYKSLPNMMFGEYELISPKVRQTETTFYYRANSSEPNNNYISNYKDEGRPQQQPTTTEEPPEEEEHAVSGRLEIRLSRERIAKESSPNPEESVYFDAVVTANGPVTTIDDDKKIENVQYEEEFLWNYKKEPQEKKYDIKVYEDSLKIQKYKIVTVDKSDDALEGADEEEVERVQEVSTQSERNENERYRDCSNSRIPVFTNATGSRMLSQRSSWTGYWPEEPDISDLTPGELTASNSISFPYSLIFIQIHY